MKCLNNQANTGKRERGEIMCNHNTPKDIIPFSFNWNNKLDNKAFTTIRLHNPNKYKQGLAFKIELKGELKGKAELREIRTLRASQLNNFMCYLDTGYSKQETFEILKKMYSGIDLETALIDFCLLVYIRVNPGAESTKAE